MTSCCPGADGAARAPDPAEFLQRRGREPWPLRPQFGDHVRPNATIPVHEGARDVGAVLA